MGVDIRIRTNRPQPRAPLAITLNDDGYYWALHPLFERLRDECGKYVDLYGDALFARDDYPRLRRLLDEAEAMAKQQPKEWKVLVGTQLQPTRKELYRTVARDNLIEIITTLRNMVDAADEIGGVLECTGD